MGRSTASGSWRWLPLVGCEPGRQRWPRRGSDSEPVSGWRPAQQLRGASPGPGPLLVRAGRLGALVLMPTLHEPLGDGNGPDQNPSRKPPCPCRLVSGRSGGFGSPLRLRENLPENIGLGSTHPGSRYSECRFGPVRRGRRPPAGWNDRPRAPATRRTRSRPLPRRLRLRTHVGTVFRPHRCSPGQRGRAQTSASGFGR
jgi:hypothetical protein